jgi:hypothetical protein
MIYAANMGSLTPGFTNGTLNLAAWTYQMPETLSAFALDESRYSMQGEPTLHHAWLVRCPVEMTFTHTSLPISGPELG